MTAPLADYLHSIHACPDAVEWAEPYVTDYTRAWAECQRGDWMLWLAGKLAGEPGSDARRPLVLAACECARQALRYVPDGEDRPRIAIETAERWARGDVGVTLDNVRRAAAYAAYAAAYAAASAAAYAADAAAAYAADAASAAAAYAASAAAYAAAASAAYAADAAAYAADAAARSASLAASADIVRKHYPTPPVTP